MLIKYYDDTLVFTDELLQLFNEADTNDKINILRTEMNNDKSSYCDYNKVDCLAELIDHKEFDCAKALYEEWFSDKIPYYFPTGLIECVGVDTVKKSIDNSLKNNNFENLDNICDLLEYNETSYVIDKLQQLKQNKNNNISDVIDKLQQLTQNKNNNISEAGFAGVVDALIEKGEIAYAKEMIEQGAGVTATALASLMIYDKEYGQKIYQKTDMSDGSKIITLISLVDKKEIAYAKELIDESLKHEDSWAYKPHENIKPLVKQLVCGLVENGEIDYAKKWMKKVYDTNNQIICDASLLFLKNNEIEFAKFLCDNGGAGSIKHACAEIVNNKASSIKDDEGISMCVRDSLHSSNIKILDDGKIAFGAIYEDRNWIKETFIGNAVEWKWYGCVAVVDLAKQEIVDSARTKSIKVRDRQSSAKDIWQDIDTHNFMRVKNNTIEVKLGEYTRTSLKYTPQPCVKYVDKISGIRNKLHQKDAPIEVVTPEPKKQNTTNVVLSNKGKSGYGD